VVRFAVVYLVVVALHAGWDSTGSGWAHAALAVASLGLLLRTAHGLRTSGNTRVAQAAPGLPQPISGIRLG
jgi:hypothetical protein